MASLSHNKERQRCRIFFVAPDGSRRCLGITQRKSEKEKGLLKRAHSLLTNVEKLIEYRGSGTALDNTLLKWIEGLKPNHRKTLTECGLLEEPDDGEELPPPTLREFCKQWMKDFDSGKPGTQNVRQRALNHLEAFFDEHKTLQDLTEYDAECYGKFLRQEQALAESTARKMLSIAKQMLRAAVKARLIDQNPFASEKTSPPKKAKEKQYHVSDAEVQAIYRKCPNTEWQAFLILGRYAGLRLPSEICELKWTDINWKTGLMTIHSPKLQKSGSSGIRQVPLFPQVRTVLQKLWSENPDEYVLPSLRRVTNVNPLFRRIVKDAGVKPWPDLCYNLRQSAINDAEHNPRFTTKNVSDWFGNSEQTRLKHYSRTLAEDISAATEGDGRELGWMSEDQMVAFWSQQPTESGSSDSQRKNKTPENSGVYETLQEAAEGVNGPNWT
ncbi:MAG: hypothetical protein Fues2KO_50510 [Fuerstiella sp.]